MKLYYETELYHFGVKGMKWGKRKAQARADYKSARRKALDDFYKKVDPLEENYEWGHKDGHGGLSKEARAGIDKADKEYKSAINKAKADYKQAKTNIKSDKRAELEAYTKEHPYKYTLTRNAKLLGTFSTVGLASYAVGKQLTKRGHQAVGAILEGGGEGFMKGSVYGAAASTAVVAGSIAINKIIQSKKNKKNKKGA